MSYHYLDNAGLGAIAGAMVFFIIIMLIIFAALYIYQSFALMAIARKTKTKNGWLAWVPIGNIYLMTQIAKVSGWWTLSALAAFVPIIGMFIFLGIYTWLWWKICEARNKPGWWALLMLIPILNLVMMGIVAWKD